MQESESEDEGLEEIDEENDHEPEMAAEKEPVIQKPAEKEPVVPKDDRQLSKKELKKKELAELEAVLAEFGLAESSGQEDSRGKNLYALFMSSYTIRTKIIYLHLHNLELLVSHFMVKGKLHQNVTKFALVPTYRPFGLKESLELESRDNEIPLTLDLKIPWGSWYFTEFHRICL